MSIGDMIGEGLHPLLGSLVSLERISQDYDALHQGKPIENKLIGTLGECYIICRNQPPTFVAGVCLMHNTPVHNHRVFKV